MLPEVGETPSSQEQVAAHGNYEAIPVPGEGDVAQDGGW